MPDSRNDAEPMHKRQARPSIDDVQAGHSRTEDVVADELTDVDRRACKQNLVRPPCVVSIPPVVSALCDDWTGVVACWLAGACVEIALERLYVALNVASRREASQWLLSSIEHQQIHTHLKTSVALMLPTLDWT